MKPVHKILLGAFALLITGLFIAATPEYKVTTIIKKTGDGFRLDTLDGTETENFTLPRTLLNANYEYEPVDWQVRLTNYAGTDTVYLYLEETLDSTNIGWSRVDTILSAQRMTGNNSVTVIARAPEHKAPHQRLSAVVSGSSGSAKTKVHIATRIRYQKQ